MIPATSVAVAAVYPFLTSYEYTRIERILSKRAFLFGADSHTCLFVSFNHFLKKSARRYTSVFFVWRQFRGL